MADTYMKRVILINEVRNTVKGNLRGPNLQGKEFNNILREQNNLTNRNTKSQKGYWSALTQTRISFFNIALVAGMVGMAYNKLTEAASETELSITKVAAVTGETNAVLEDQIRLLQSGSIYSLKEVADAYLEISKRGFGAADSFEIVSASMNLAVSEVTSLEAASTLVVQTINQFGLEASNATHIANALSGAAVLTASNIDSLTNSMGMVGSIADQAGVSFENTAAALGILMDSGLRATKAGTGLRAMLNKILSPSKQAESIMNDLGVSLFDVEGKIKSLDRIMRDFGVALENTADDQERLDSLMTVFGIRGGPAAAALFKEYKEGGNTISSLTAKMNTLDFAAQQAEKQMESMANRSLAAAKNIEAQFYDIGLGVKSFGTILKETLTTPEIHNQSVLFVNMAENLKKMGGAGREASDELLKMENLKLLTPAMLENLELSGAITSDMADQAMRLNEEEQKLMGFSASREKNIGKLIEINRELLGVREEVIKQNSELATLREYDAQTLLDSIKNQTEYAGILDIVNDGVSEHTKQMESAVSMERSAGEAINELLQAFTSFGSELVDMNRINDWIRAIEETGEISNETATEIMNYNRAVKANMDLVGGGQNAFIGFRDSLKSMKEGFTELIPEEELARRELENLTSGWIDSINSAEEFNKISGTTSDTAKGLVADYVNLTQGQDVWNNKLDDSKDRLKELNKELSKYEGLVGDVLGKRFAGETRVQKMIYEQEKALKEADLAALGVTDAYDYLSSAVVITDDSYSSLKGTIEEVTDAAKDSASAFDAWQTSIREHVRALILEGSDLGTDVSRSVRQQATRGLSMGLFDEGGESETERRRRLMEENLEKLRLANEVTYGDMHQQLQFYNQEHEDSVNGVNQNLESAKAALDGYWSKIDSINAKIAEQNAIQDSAASKLEEYETGLNDIDLSPFITEIDKAIAEVEKLMAIKARSVTLPETETTGTSAAMEAGSAEVIRSIEEGGRLFKGGEIKSTAGETLTKESKNTNINGVNININGNNKDGYYLAREIMSQFSALAND